MHASKERNKIGEQKKEMNHQMSACLSFGSDAKYYSNTALWSPWEKQLFVFLKVWNHSCFQGVLSGLRGRPAAASLSWGQGFFPFGLSESSEGYSLVLENVKGACGDSCLKEFWRYWEYVVQIFCRAKKF